ncbi:MAG TPA: DUF2452 domain-containing protein [Opitutales bacterium]|nr:DUF2452 domain-containing protein [Opitutales bacterium]
MAQRNPNPQGKGLVPILATLAEGRAAIADVPPKRIEQVSTELFTSLFVLESDFKFKPTAGQAYWLYRKEGRFWLSQISPEEWSGNLAGQFVGKCFLEEDLTWTLDLSDEAGEDAELMKLIEERHRALEKEIRNAKTLEEILPRFNESLAFYQRAFSYALAHSLRASLTKSGILSLNYDDAQAQQSLAAASK